MINILWDTKERNYRNACKGIVEWAQEHPNAKRGTENLLKAVMNDGNRLHPDLSLVRLFAGLCGRQGDKNGGK